MKKPILCALFCFCFAASAYSQQQRVIARGYGEADLDAVLRSTLAGPHQLITADRTISRGDVAPALEDALFAAKAKQVVGPIASGQGYVVFTVDEHLESAALSYEEAKDRIREQLEQEGFFKAQAEMRQQLRAKAHIDIRL